MDTIAQGNAFSRLRSRVRGSFFAALRHVASIDDTRQVLSAQLRLHNLLGVPKELTATPQPEAPYPGLGGSPAVSPRSRGEGAIFISGRFRSGSTLLWNLFRNVPGVTAYYEPFNERRWFDPNLRGQHTDSSHFGVDDYWSEYDGLEKLGAFFDPDWKFRHLHMTESTWNPAMRSYIQCMLEGAPGRPVLQFNEVDFRLGWLRANFPLATLLHLVRHPRDQWCSSLGSHGVDMHTLTNARFRALDGFYLLDWARDLRHEFPFLSVAETDHPYELFYQVWKLSYLFGAAHAHLTLRYEDLVARPRESLEQVFSRLSIPGSAAASVAGLVHGASVGKWRRLADDELFAELEGNAEKALALFIKSGPDVPQPHSRPSLAA